MSRGFIRASSEFLENDSAPVTTPPFSMGCWFLTTELASDKNLMWLGDKDTDLDYYNLFIRSNEELRVISIQAGPIFGFADTSTTISSGVWHCALGVWSAIDNRAIYLDGGGKGTNAVSITPTTPDRIAIGANRDSTPGTYMDGNIAEAAIWNIDLTDAEAGILALGYSPLFVRPQNLVFYAPLIRDLDFDRVGGLSLTIGETPTVENHPPVIMMPGINSFLFEKGVVIPVMNAHYRQQLQQ